MTVVLIVSSTPEESGALTHAIQQSGFTPATLFASELPMDALERTQAHVVLLDTEYAAPASFVTSARRVGATVLYFSSVLSAYELATYARRRGVSHFPISAGARMLRPMVTELLALRALPPLYPAESIAPPVMKAAELSIARARAMFEHSQELVRTSREARAERRIAAATCRHNLDVLRQSVKSTTAELRDTGMSIERVMDIVRRGFEHGCSTTNDIEPGMDEVMAWCQAAYVAA